MKETGELRMSFRQRVRDMLARTIVTVGSKRTRIQRVAQKDEMTARASCVAGRTSRLSRPAHLSER